MLLAYHNKPALKSILIAQLTEDAELDRIVKGQYWGNGKGCAIGCTIRGNLHAEYETQLGIPQSIARLEDAIFEGLPNADAKEFPLQFANAIRPGADLSKVTAKFLVWCLLDEKHGAIRNVPKDKYADCHSAILAVADVWNEYIKTGVIDKSAAAKAAKAAESTAAESATWAAESAAWASRTVSAAWAVKAAVKAAAKAAKAAKAAESTAAESATWAAESAAWASRTVWAARASRASRTVWAARAAEAVDFWKVAAVTLIKLLKAA